MSARRGLAACALALLLAGGAAGQQAPAGEETPAGGVASVESLDALLGATGPDGAPVVGEAERAYLQGLSVPTRQALAAAAASGMIANAAHLRTFLQLGLSDPKMALLARDNCLLCHTDLNRVPEELLVSPDPAATHSAKNLNLRDYVRGVHFRRDLSCAGCHGGDPRALKMSVVLVPEWPDEFGREDSRAWVPALCARCHNDPVKMRDYGSDLPTDQFDHYQTSLHGRDVLEHDDMRAAECTSCHGSHGILGPLDSASPVNPHNVPATCGRCHADAKLMGHYKLPDGSAYPTDQLEEYRQSVHGRALLERDDLGAPSCASCHGPHDAKVDAGIQACGRCHTIQGEVFGNSRLHQVFTDRGYPQCASCHGSHDVQEVTDDFLIGQRCAACHQEAHVQRSDCLSAPAHMFGAIRALLDGQAELDADRQRMARAGLDVEPLQDVQQDLEEAVRKTRAGVHTFNLSAFDQIDAQASAQVERGRELVKQGKAELGFRRKGLLASVLILLFLALLVYLKVRQLEAAEVPRS